MKVTHIITRLVVGGAQENTLATVRGLRAKPGVEVNLIAGPAIGPEGSLETEARRFFPTLNPQLPIINFSSSPNSSAPFTR